MGQGEVIVGEDGVRFAAHCNVQPNKSSTLCLQRLRDQIPAQIRARCIWVHLRSMHRHLAPAGLLRAQTS